MRRVVKFRSLSHLLLSNSLLRKRHSTTAQHGTGLFVRPLNINCGLFFRLLKDFLSSWSQSAFDNKNVSCSCCGSLNDCLVVNECRALLHFGLEYDYERPNNMSLVSWWWVVLNVGMKWRHRQKHDKVKKSGSVCLLTKCLPEKRHARTSCVVASLSYHLTLNRTPPTPSSGKLDKVGEDLRMKHRLL